MASDKQLHSDDTYNLLAEKDIVVLNAQDYLRRSLVQWTIRSVLGLGLFGFLASRFSWGIWVFLGWLLLALLSLAIPIHGAKQIARRSQRIEKTIEAFRPNDSVYRN